MNKLRKSKVAFKSFMKSDTKQEELSVYSEIATTFSVHWSLMFVIESTIIKGSVQFYIIGRSSMHYLRKRNEAKK